jgi:hypothetical protein
MRNWTYVELEGLDPAVASSTSDWFDARSFAYMMFLVKWPAAASGAGAFRIEATMHEPKDAVTIEDVTAAVTTAYGPWPNLPLLADSSTVPVTHPFPFMRLALDMTIINADWSVLAYAFGRRES